MTAFAPVGPGLTLTLPDAIILTNQLAPYVVCGASVLTAGNLESYHVMPMGWS